MIKKFLQLSFCLLFCFAYLSCENPLMIEILDAKTITFNSNGGTFIPEQLLVKNEKITRPDDPQKDTFIFEGWFTDDITFSSSWDFTPFP